MRPAVFHTVAMKMYFLIGNTFLGHVLTATIKECNFSTDYPDRTASREPNIHSGSFNNAEQFSQNLPYVYFECIVAGRPLDF